MRRTYILFIIVISGFLLGKVGQAGPLDSLKGLFGANSEAISYLGIKPGDTLEHIQELAIFKTCKRDSAFEKEASAPEVWSCKALDENVGGAVFYFWRKKLAIANFIFCPEHLDFHSKGNSSETTGIVGDAVLCSFAKNHKKAAIYENLKKQFQKFPTKSMAHVNGLIPPRDVLCANGTNRLQCEYDLWEDKSADAIVFLGSHLNDEEKRDADQLRLSDKKLENELAAHQRGQ